MQANSLEMQGIVEGLPSIAARIRALDAAGYARADIAKFLGKRYQHVRNVLVRGGRSPSLPGPDPRRPMSPEM